MKHLLKTFLILAGVLLVAGPAGAQGGTQWSGFVDRDGRVEVVNIRGTIRAVASADGQVHVNARAADPSAMRVEVEEYSGGVKVCTVPAESSGGGCSSNGRRDWSRDRDADTRVDIDVSVPQGVRFSGTSVSGDVSVEQLRSAVTLTVVSGRTEIASAGFPVRVTAVSGDVRILMPADANADFRATTVSGDIESDVPLASTRRNVRLPDGTRLFDGRGPRNVRATIGNGGAEIQVTTVSGDIEVRRR